MATLALTADDPPAARPRPTSSATRVILRLLMAAGAGLLLYACAPPRELWWLAPLAFALMWRLLRGPGAPRASAVAGFGYGVVFGLGFFVPLLPWVGEYVGALPWLALATTEALVFGLAGTGVALVSRLPAAPLWATGVWVAAEALIARVPFDGFPWGRVAFGQPTGLFLPLAAFGGAPLLSAAVVLTGFGGAELVRRAWGRQGPAAIGITALFASGPLLAGMAAGGLVTSVSGTETPTTGSEAGNADRTVVVALVQGNVPRAGLDFNSQRRAVLDNHANRTVRLATDVAAGRYPPPDLVIWPENSADIDPLRNPDARAVVDQAAQVIKAPILVGAVLRGDGDGPTNTGIVWDPIAGPGERHDKRRLQPFGEYIPYREFFRLFSPYVERAGNFVPGFGDGVVDLGPARVGVAMCYEVIFDDLVRESVRSGAEVLAVPTNNATFGFTEMTYQQQAISRVRAVEHNRTVLVAATSGVSAVINPDGSVQQRTSLFTPDAVVAHVGLNTGTTLATRLGARPEWTLAALGVLGVGIALAARISAGPANDTRRRHPSRFGEGRG